MKRGLTAAAVVLLAGCAGPTVIPDGAAGEGKAGEGCGIALLPDGEVVECAYVDGEHEGRWATRGPDGEIVTEFNPAVPPVGVSGDDDLDAFAPYQGRYAQ